MATLTEHWGVPPRSVKPCAKSRRLLEIEGLGFARVVFARGPLSATQVVELVSSLGQVGCAAPGIVRTTAGLLAFELGEVSLAVEELLPGVECSASTLGVLPLVGGELARIHEAVSGCQGAPGETRPLAPWVEEKIGKALAQVDAQQLSAVKELQAALPDDLKQLAVPWGLTHGDVRGPNVLYDGQNVGFTDFNPRYVPLLCDVAMIRNKWLMNGVIQNERPLTLVEISNFMKGYCQVRPLTQAERVAFPVIWAVYQADRLFQDQRIVSKFDSARKSRWPIEEQIAALPEEIARARLILG